MRWPWSETGAARLGRRLLRCRCPADRGSGRRHGGGCVQHGGGRGGRRGAVSRAFASAEVQGAPWVQDAVSPTVLGQMGRDLIRKGDSMHVVRVGGDGMVRLIPCSSWHWEGSHDPASPGPCARPPTVPARRQPGTCRRRRLCSSVGAPTPASPMSAWLRHHGLTQPRGSGPRSSDPLPMKLPGRSRNCWRCRRTAATMATMIRSRCSGPIFAPPEARRCWSRP